MWRGAGRAYLLAFGLVAMQWTGSRAFYIPGVAPTEYQKDKALEIRVSGEREGGWPQPRRGAPLTGVRVEGGSDRRRWGGGRY